MGRSRRCASKPSKPRCPGRTLAIRPGLIVGPHDASDRFTYWVMRVSAAGEVLAPGRPGRGLQFIDVRDLAEWTVAPDRREPDRGFNATGLPEAITMTQLLDDWPGDLGQRRPFHLGGAIPPRLKIGWGMAGNAAVGP